jgi:hypothetical protein
MDLKVSMAKLFKKLRRSSKATFSMTSDGGPNDIKEISGPTGFKHEWHVGFNAQTGNIDGLPPAWQLWLSDAKIRLVLGYRSVTIVKVFAKGNTSVHVVIVWAAIMRDVENIWKAAHSSRSINDRLYQLRLRTITFRVKTNSKRDDR